MFGLKSSLLFTFSGPVPVASDSPLEKHLIDFNVLDNVLRIPFLRISGRKTVILM